jgi:SAM-dependent methyltransferase
MKVIAEIKDAASELFDDAEAMRLEDTLWWYVGRRCILRKYLDRAKREIPRCQIVEIGCGSGGSLGPLSEYGDAIGVERSEILANRARMRNVAKDILVGDFFDIEISGDFNMFCLFDVLEHIEDDNAFLKRLNTQAKPGHLLLLSVPACQFLYSRHDALLHHHRRYSRTTLEQLLQANGYTTLKASYFLFFLFPIIAISRLKEKVMSMLGIKQSTVSFGVVPKWMNWLLTMVFKLEASLSEILSFPIGIWLIVLAKRN